MLLAQANNQTLSAQAFNIGGGLGNTLSLQELLNIINSLQDHSLKVEMSDWRVGDQRYYVSDIRKFRAATGWAPRVNVREGVKRLHHWFLNSQKLAAVEPVTGEIGALLAR
jgi:CDP-paratose 2-epimerase